MAEGANPHLRQGSRSLKVTTAKARAASVDACPGQRKQQHAWTAHHNAASLCASCHQEESLHEVRTGTEVSCQRSIDKKKKTQKLMPACGVTVHARPGPGSSGHAIETGRGENHRSLRWRRHTARGRRPSCDDGIAAHVRKRCLGRCLDAPLALRCVNRSRPRRRYRASDASLRSLGFTMRLPLERRRRLTEAVHDLTHPADEHRLDRRGINSYWVEPCAR